MEAALAIAANRFPQAFDTLQEPFLKEPDAWFQSVLLSAIALTRQQSACTFLFDLVRREYVDAEAPVQAILPSGCSPEIIKEILALQAKNRGA